jgi:hypothetical protein
MVPLQHQRQWIHARLSAISRRAPSGAPPPERPRTDDVTCMRRWLGKVEGLQVSLAGAKDKIAQIVSTLQRKSSGTDLGDVWASAGATRRGSLSSRPVRMDDPSLRPRGSMPEPGPGHRRPGSSGSVGVAANGDGVSGSQAFGSQESRTSEARCRSLRPSCTLAIWMLIERSGLPRRLG